MNTTSFEKIEQTADEKCFIDRFASEFCRPHADVLRARVEAYRNAHLHNLVTQFSGDFALAAGASAPKLEEVCSPDEEVVFTFASDGAPDAPGAWKANLRVPPKAGAETMLTLELEDGSDGLFKLSGTTLPVVAGRAQLPFGIFLAGIKDAEISFKRANAAQPVTGTLAFFC